MHGQISKDQTNKPGLPPFMSVQSDGITLAIKLQPRASANEILPYDRSAAELRVRVTAPPVDAAANEALIRLLAERLDCPRSAVQLVRGQTSRHKMIKLHGLTANGVLAKLTHK